MSDDNLMDKYVQRLNEQLLPTVDFTKMAGLQNTIDLSYAGNVLKQMHGLFIEIYGTATLDQSLAFVCVPAVLRGKRSGETAIGLVTLDLQSSGEHWGTHFFTKMGVIEQGGEHSKFITNQINQLFIPYDYWYTLEIPCDIHISQSPPEEVQRLLVGCPIHCQEMRMD